MGMVPPCRALTESDDISKVMFSVHRRSIRTCLAAFGKNGAPVLSATGITFAEEGRFDLAVKSMVTGVCLTERG